MVLCQFFFLEAFFLQQKQQSTAPILTHHRGDECIINDDL